MIHKRFKKILQYISVVALTTYGYSAYAVDYGDFHDATTFSYIVYDDWNNPTKPIPAGWSYYQRAKDELLFDGYYGASFLKRNFSDQGKLCSCELFISHRGTMPNIWDYFEDFLVYLNKVPDYYKNAQMFVDDTINAAKKDCKNVSLDVKQTGHSLGGLLSELVMASGKYPYISTFVFDTPGARNIISRMIQDKLLPYNSMKPPRNLFSVFSHPNAINTCNEQWTDLIILSALPIPFEDFNKTNLDRINFPGRAYYFQYFTLHQHQMENFYHYFHLLDELNKHSYKLNELNINNYKSDIFSPWPIGFKSVYRNYFNYDMYGMYWKDVMNYVWNNSDAVRKIYTDDYYKYKGDFYVRLDKEMELDDDKNIKYDKSSFDYPLGLEKNLLYDRKIYGNLSNVVLNGYTGHVEQLKQYYNASNVDKKLYLSVLVNDVPLAMKLITDGHANVNTTHGEKKFTLVQIAILLGHLDMVKLLLDNHAGTNIKNADGETALHTLAHERYGDIAKYAQLLIRAGANINSRTSSGDTPEKIISKKCLDCLYSFKSAASYQGTM